MEANAVFAQKYQLPFPLLSDETGEVCQAYDSCDDLASGRVRRNTFVIGPEGEILKKYQDVNPRDQAEMVLAFLEESTNLTYQKRAPAARSSLIANNQTDSIEREFAKEKTMEDQTNKIRNDIPHEGNGASVATEQPATDPALAVSPASMPVGDDPQPEALQTVAPGQVQPAQNGGSPALVFALGTLGYDFGSEARRDSLLQHMGSDDIVTYLDKNPSQAASVIWTLNLDATPIYAIQPQGAYASECYDQLIQFLREQIEKGVERVSVPGIIHGQVRLLSGQVVPIIWPEMRCMYSWTTAALVEAVCGKPPANNAKAEAKQAYAEKVDAVTNFLSRVYDELRNLGVSSQDRAINYAGSNVANAANIFESALKKEMELYSIDAAPSQICRPGSDCWEVRLAFFDPENVLRAKRVYGFTTDVSDVCPVMVGNIRSWSMP